MRYFHRDDEYWRVNEHLRARVIFRQFNLLSDFSELGEFDVVFCRNVLMYFHPGARRDVLSRLSQALAPDGYLFLGAGEGVGDAAASFEPAAAAGVFRIRGAAKPRLRFV